MTNLMSFRQSHLRGTLRPYIDIPGDKSMSHRALFISALATGTTFIEGLNTGTDMEHTQMALESLGVIIENKGFGKRLVRGLGGAQLHQPKNPLYLGNSGSSARFLMGLAAPYPITMSLYGDSSLSHRPMRRISLPLMDLGAKFKMSADDLLPLTMTGSKTPKPIHYRMPLPSAQLKAALILAAMSTPGTTQLIEPIRTRDHMERFLIHLKYPHFSDTLCGDGHLIQIQGCQQFQGAPIFIPVDPSAAAFFVVAALITPHSRISVQGINWNPYRNRVYDVLQRMGAQIDVCNLRETCGETLADLEIRASSLHNITIDEHEVPALIDEYPILSIAAAYASGISVFKGLRELRYKESNRLESIHRNLCQCGIEARIDNDTLIIQGNGGNTIFGGISLNSQKDHRIAMSFYVLGMLARNPIIIQGTDCIASSFPNFFDVMNNLSYMKAA